MTSYTANAWEAREVHKDTVCLFVTVLIWQGCSCPSGSPSVVSVWTDMWTLGVLQKQESEGEEVLWLAGRETPQHDRGGPPQTAESRGWTLQRLLWRRSQAVQLPLVQAFPVLEIVVQVLHKIREVCKRWETTKRSWNSDVIVCF